MDEFSSFKSSPLVGKGLQEVAKLSVIIGWSPGDDVLHDIFDPRFKLKEGDALLVLGDPRKL